MHIGNFRLIYSGTSDESNDPISDLLYICSLVLFPFKLLFSVRKNLQVPYTLLL